jgi:hypothetical protein
MMFPDEVLMAYADDELDARTRAAVDAAMASDPEIARRIAQHKALRRRVHSAFDKVADEPVPARLLEVVRSAPSGSRESNIVPLRRGPVRRWTWPQWGAIAASLIVGVLAGRLVLVRSQAPDIIAMRGGRIVAGGVLAHALTDQLTADQSAADPVRIGVSFRSKSGEYCRTFTVRQPAALAGLACRAADGWRVGALAHAQSPAGGPGGYRQAASSLPPAIVAAVSDRIAGEPLDAHAEAAARGHHWQP